MARLHRIYNDQLLQPEQSLSLSDETAHYLTRVVRVSVGQTIVLFNGDGSDYPAEIVKLDRAGLDLLILGRLPARSESPLNITLVQAISRGDRMDVTLQKSTELGVSSVQPVFSMRTEVRLDEKRLSKRMAHWRKVIISACEQSGRARLPHLHPPLELEDWVRQESSSKRLMLSPLAAQPLARLGPGPAVEVLVGPEGGLDQREVKMLDQQGVLSVSLGPRILRTETAGPAAVAILQATAGDMV